jgi:hypothetical protein
MFDHVRQRLTAALAQAESELILAQQSIQPLRDKLAAEQARLATQQAAVSSAVQRVQSGDTAREAAQATVNQRQSGRDAAAVNRDKAQAGLEMLLDMEPEPDLPNGKPNPAWAAWQAKVKAAQTSLQTAESALRTAEGALVSAVQARDAAAHDATNAANALTDLQTRIATIQASITNLEAAVTAAPGDISAKREAVDQANMALAALDERVKQLLADPIDKLSVERIANQEYAELADLREQRAEILQSRVFQVAEKARLLAEHDAAVAALIQLRDAIGGWPDAVRFGQLATARRSIDTVVSAAQQQQDLPAEQRSDNLGAAWTGLGEALVAIQTATTKAISERDQAQSALSDASEALADHQKEGP